jgi:hypothetical protein
MKNYKEWLQEENTPVAPEAQPGLTSGIEQSGGLNGIEDLRIAEALKRHLMRFFEQPQFNRLSPATRYSLLVQVLNHFSDDMTKQKAQQAVRSAWSN